MFDPPRRRLQRMDLPPEAPLASDLEWILQSGRATRALLAEVLLREYYSRVASLATGLLGTSKAGHEAALDAIATAVAQAHRYRNGADIDDWFFGLARKSLLKAERSYKKTQLQPQKQQSPRDDLQGDPPPFFDGIESQQKHPLWSGLETLPPQDRLLLLVQARLGWDTERIGKVFRLPAPWVSSRLSSQITRLTKDYPPPAGIPDPRVWLIGQIGSLVPAAELDEAGLAQASQVVLTRSRSVTWLRGNSTVFNEIVLLGFVLILVVLVFFGASRLAAEPPESASPWPKPAVPSVRLLQPPASTRTPRPTRTPTPLPSPTPEGIFYTGYSGLHFANIATLLGVDVDELRTLNRIPEDKVYSDGQPLIIPGRLQALDLPVPTPVPAMTKTRALTAPQPGEDVRDLLNIDNPPYSTLWVDSLVLARYGSQMQPAPIAWRVQFWFGIDKGLIISGPAGSNPSLVVLWTSDETYIVRPKRGSLWYERFSNFDEQELEFRPLMGVAAVLGFLAREDNRLTFVSQESLLEREVWVVDETGSRDDLIRRRWIDPQTGLTLRMKNLGGPVYSGQSRAVEVPDEVAVQAVQYNPDFPPELFDPRLPWRGGYAKNASGEPALNSAPPLAWISLPQPGELKRAPLPENLDLSKSQLLMLNRFDASAPQPRTEIYADGYYLGAAPFSHPWRLWCQRSPDGLKLAYTEPTTWYIDFPVSLSGLFWLDLHHPEQQYVVFPEQAVTSASYAFSPDSRWLAFWACVPGTDRCGVYVHDTESRENRLLLSQYIAMTAFIWSPDGDLVSAVSEAGQLFTVRLEDDRLMHIANNYQIGEPAPPLSPVAEWALPFPPVMGDLSDCATPP